MPPKDSLEKRTQYQKLARTFVLPLCTRRMFDHGDGKSEQQGATLKLLATTPPAPRRMTAGDMNASGNGYPQLSPTIQKIKIPLISSTADLGYSHRLLALYGAFPPPQLQAFDSLLWNSQEFQSGSTPTSPWVIPSLRASIAKPASSVSLLSRARGATPPVFPLGCYRLDIAAGRTTLTSGIPNAVMVGRAPLTAWNCECTRLAQAFGIRFSRSLPPKQRKNTIQELRGIVKRKS